MSGTEAELLRSCSLPYKHVPGLGPIAKFDALSNNHVCKRMYNDGTRTQRTELVQRFCGRYGKNDLPERCKCYRFRDTPEYKQYRSLWTDLLDSKKSRPKGVSGDPLIGSYTCFYEGCTGDPNAYTTADMVDNMNSCPTVVYCKQEFGDITIDTPRGKPLSEVTLEIQQKCGATVNHPNKPNKPEEPPAEWDYWTIGAVAAGVALALLALLVLLRR